MANLYSLPKLSMGFAVSAALVLLLVARFGSASNIERTPLEMIQSVSDSEASPTQQRSNAEPDTMAASRAGPVPTGFHTLTPGQSVTIESENYPSGYYPQKYDKHVWFFRGTCTESTISITCSGFRLNECIYSEMSISGLGMRETFCDNGPDLTSKNNDMTVAFRVRKNFRKILRGFTCTVSASVPDAERISSLDSRAAESRNQKSTCNCGQRNPVARIIGGQEATMNGYPWHVGIRVGSDESPICGGSIITDRHILTAATCVERYPDEDINVLIGYHSSNAGPQSDTANNVKVHPDYNSNTLENDIALIEISTPLDFSTNNLVAPICLPDEGNPYDDAVATVVGWGESQEGGPPSLKLNEVVLPTLTHCKCQEMYGDRVTDNMICAGLKEGGRDACELDSGGALVTGGDCQDTFKVVIGIRSWGSCGKPEEPGVYTRVSDYLEWINSETEGSTSCPTP